MATNDPQRPEVARAAQDVEGPAKVSEPKGAIHYGRGGAANIIENNGETRKSGDAKRKSIEVKPDEGNGKGGLMTKGKDFLNKLGKK
jgi:hypothetical protein